MTYMSVLVMTTAAAVVVVVDTFDLFRVRFVNV
jgi:hypothetical protein